MNKMKFGFAALFVSLLGSGCSLDTEGAIVVTERADTLVAEGPEGSQVSCFIGVARCAILVGLRRGCDHSDAPERCFNNAADDVEGGYTPAYCWGPCKTQ